MQKCFQLRWSEVLEVILTCFPPPRPSRAENVRLCWRSVSQTISSIFVSSNCDIFNNHLSVLTVIFLTTKHLHIVLQCLFFTMACLKSSLWTIYTSQSFFSASVGKGLAVFLYFFHTSILIGPPVCASWSVMTALYPLLLPLWHISPLLLKSSLWYPEWWNLHSPHKKDCLHIQMILWHPWYRINLLDAEFRPWYLWEQDLGAKCLS